MELESRFDLVTGLHVSETDEDHFDVIVSGLEAGDSDRRSLGFRNRNFRFQFGVSRA